MESSSNIVVRYAETDQMGIAHHSNYPVWFEVGRTDFIKTVGYTYSGIEALGILFPLYELSCKYISPARYEDRLLIKTTLKLLTRVRIGFFYQVFHADSGLLIAEGETLHAWTNRAFKPVNAQKVCAEIYEAFSAISH